MTSHQWPMQHSVAVRSNRGTLGHTVTISGHQVAMSGHQAAIKWPSSGHQVVIKRP